MIIRHYSDLHLEFNKYTLSKLPQDATSVLLLTGDIGTLGSHRSWIERACKQFKVVVYILGNHEYYNGEYYEVNHYWRDRMKDQNNLYILNNETQVFGDVRIIGSAMWTDLDKRDPFHMWNIPRGMNDFHVIRVNEEAKEKRISRKGSPKGERFSAEFHCNLYDDAVAYIESELKRDWAGITIVATHHNPSHRFNEEKYANSPLSPAFHANADHLFTNYKVDYWFCGHTHKCLDEEHEGCRFISNQRGYLSYGEKDIGFDHEFWIDTDIN